MSLLGNIFLALPKYFETVLQRKDACRYGSFPGP